MKRLALMIFATGLLGLAGCASTSPFWSAGPAPQSQPKSAAATAEPEKPVVAAVATDAAATGTAKPGDSTPDAVIKLKPGSAQLSAEMDRRLMQVAAQAKADERIILRLESYVPGGGSASLNLLKAEQSVDLVRKRLIDLEVNPRRILTAPFGAEYDTERDERRYWVEIYLVKPRL